MNQGSNPFESFIFILIFRTKNAVRDLDNLNYRKMKKILMAEMVETESTIGQDIEDDVSSIQAAHNSWSQAKKEVDIAL